jgi:hypothetical protein
MPENTVEAAFTWKTWMCRLLQGSEEQDADATIDTISAFTAAHYARQGADFVPLRKPHDLLAAPGGQRKLFHEHVHYWQMLFCSALQGFFVTTLNRMGVEARRFGTGARWVSHFPTSDADLKALEEREESLLSHFSSELDELDRTWVCGTDEVPGPLKTAMLFLQLPHQTPGQSLPAYGASMEFPAGGACFVPFTAPHLWEAAAQLCESLAAGEVPRRARGDGTKQDVLYYGVWEFWCRLHGRRYADARDLAFGFLAAVDLALSTALFAPKADLETRAERSSIPYRFGKIAFRAQGLAPIEGGAADPAKAVSDWQDAYCRWCGLPCPAADLRDGLLVVTRLLMATAAHRISDTPKNLAVLEELMGLDPAGAWTAAALEPSWSLLRDVQSRAPAIGELAARTMLNAMVYRLRYPGRNALPHVYREQLEKAFPLPFLLDRGDYVMVPPGGPLAEPTGPLPVAPLELVHDIIGLATVEPLVHRDKSCGFLKYRTDCWYLRAGLGCPQKSLDPKQKGRRAAAGLDDWCHWMLRAVLLETAPADRRARWLDVWHGGATMGSESP